MLMSVACSGADNPTGAGRVPGSVRLALSAGIVANPGAVVEGLVTYTPSTGGTAQTVARDSLVVNTGGTDAALSLAADVTACVRDAAAAGSAPCALDLTVRLKRAGVVLDESSQRLTVAAGTDKLDASPVQLFEVATVRIAPATIANAEPGDSVVLSATPLDRAGGTVAGRAPTWSVVSGGVSVGTTGVLRALASGPAVVRAAVGGRTQDLSLTVGAASVASIDLAPADTTISVGANLPYRVTARSATGAVLTGRTIAVTSSNPSVASVNAAGLAGALSIGQVVITARSTEGRNGATITASTALRVEAAPVVQLAPSALSFETELGQPLPAASTVAITNAGAGSLGSLSVFIGSDSLVTATLDRTTAPAVLTVRPSTRAASAQLAVNVPTQSIVRVRSTTIGVPDGVLTVTLTRRPSPQILLNRTLVAYDSVPQNTVSAVTSVAITSPTRPLAGLQLSVNYLQAVAPWLTATLVGTSTPASFTVRASAGTLPAGTYTADVTVSATDPSQPVIMRVSMRVPPPASVVLSAASLTFGPLDPSVIAGPAQVVNVTSSNGAIVLSGLSSSIVYLGTGTGWLSTTLQSTTATPTTMSVTPRPTGLADGIYQALIIVASSTGGASSDTVNAQLTVRRDSILTTPDSLAFTLLPGEQGAAQSVSLRTVSGDTLRLDTPGYSVTYDQPASAGWLQAVSLSGQLLPASLRFTPVPQINLAPGTYTARIAVTARNGARVGRVKVTLTVSGFAAVATGTSHACALKIGGALYCWGDNFYGQAATALKGPITLPVRAPSAPVLSQIDAGYAGTCGLTATGVAYCWGQNMTGALGNGTIDVSDPVVMNPIPVPVSGGLTFAQISAAGLHACGLTTVGTAYCWGSNDYGEGGNAALGNLLVPTRVDGGRVFVQLATGWYHSCGRTAAGAVYCWGNNSRGELGNGTQTPSTTPVLVGGGLTYLDIDAGEYHTCGRTSAGPTYCWGANDQGQLGNGTISSFEVTPVPVATTASFVRVTMGGSFSCGMVANGSALCWGANDVGQLGNGSTGQPSPSPAAVSGGVSFTSLSANGRSTCGRSTVGTIYCWGGNAYGQLGNGGLSPSASPLQIGPPSGFVTSASRASTGASGFGRARVAPPIPPRPRRVVRPPG
jgi:alpha-tubulin suppressor-like RCC1 family protein